LPCRFLESGAGGEGEGHRSDLDTTRQVIVSLSHGEPALPEPPDLPGNPAYQNILAALADSPEPVRAKDLCHRLDLGLEPKNRERIAHGNAEQLLRIPAVERADKGCGNQPAEL
jgi:hypothetical protein